MQRHPAFISALIAPLTPMRSIEAQVWRIHHPDSIPVTHSIGLNQVVKLLPIRMVPLFAMHTEALTQSLRQYA